MPTRPSSWQKQATLSHILLVAVRTSPQATPSKHGWNSRTAIIVVLAPPHPEKKDVPPWEHPDLAAPCNIVIRWGSITGSRDVEINTPVSVKNTTLRHCVFHLSQIDILIHNHRRSYCGFGINGHASGRLNMHRLFVIARRRPWWRVSGVLSIIFSLRVYKCTSIVHFENIKISRNLPVISERRVVAKTVWSLVVRLSMDNNLRIASER